MSFYHPPTTSYSKCNHPRFSTQTTAQRHFLYPTLSLFCPHLLLPTDINVEVRTQWKKLFLHDFALCELVCWSFSCPKRRCSLHRRMRRRWSHGSCSNWHLRSRVCGKWSRSLVRCSFKSFCEQYSKQTIFHYSFQPQFACDYSYSIPVRNLHPHVLLRLDKVWVVTSLWYIFVRQ